MLFQNMEFAMVEWMIKVERSKFCQFTSMKNKTRKKSTLHFLLNFHMHPGEFSMQVNKLGLVAKRLLTTKVYRAIPKSYFVTFEKFNVGYKGQLKTHFS